MTPYVPRDANEAADLARLLKAAQEARTAASKNLVRAVAELQERLTRRERER